MEKSEKVLLLSTIVLVGFVAAVVFHYILGFYLNKPLLFDSFLFPSFASFCDIFDILPYIKDFKPYQEITLWVTYFPLTYIFMLPFVFIKNKILAYLIYTSGFLFYFTYMNIKTFSCEKFSKMQNFQNIFILTTITYPFLYIMDKGNFDMFLFILFGLFVYAFKKEKYFLAAVLLAVQNACKPLFILYLILFLMKKKYKETVLSLILTAILVLGSFMIFGEPVLKQLIALANNLAFYKYRYTIFENNDFGMYYASSLYMMLKLFLCNITSTPIVNVVLLTKIYDYFSCVATVMTIFFVWREKIYWKQLTLLICNFLLLHWITYDYKFIFLFVPIWLFISVKEKTKFDLVYTILFGLLFIPKHIVVANPTTGLFVKHFSLSIIINPILLTILCGLIIYEQFCKKERV